MFARGDIVNLEFADESDVWIRYRAQGREEDRDWLICRYTPFATMHAAKLFADRQIREIEFDEFRQYALVGLLESLSRYDPEKGVSFSAFSSHRIRGAVLNGIEKYNEKQQQISARARLREERFRGFLKEVGDTEPDPFFKLVDLAIGTAIGFILEGSCLYQGGDGSSYDQNVYKRYELEDLTRVLVRLVDTLPEQEQTVIRYHYFQQFRFDAIAEEMGLSKGRVSQIHHRALKRMREHHDQLKLLRTDY